MVRLNKKSACLLLFIFVLHAKCISQNLVPNASFEEYANCPDGDDQLYLCNYWFNPTDASPDYFNRCSKDSLLGIPYNCDGYQQLRSGNAYAGIINFDNEYQSYREFIGAKLLEPLKSGKTYQISMYVSLSDSSQFANNRFGISLSREDKPQRIHAKTNAYNLWQCDNNILVRNNNIGYDTTYWHLIKVDYVAKGNEAYLFIGLCRNNVRKGNYLAVKYFGKTHNGHNGYAYYYIDDVAVEEKNYLPASRSMSK